MLVVYVEYYSHLHNNKIRKWTQGNFGQYLQNCKNKSTLEYIVTQMSESYNRLDDVRSTPNQT